jgi:hypothetical protein
MTLGARPNMRSVPPAAPRRRPALPHPPGLPEAIAQSSSQRGLLALAPGPLLATPASPHVAQIRRQLAHLLARMVVEHVRKSAADNASPTLTVVTP